MVAVVVPGQAIPTCTPVIVYVLVTVGETVILAVVAPVDQVYEAAPLTVSVDELPIQIVVEATVSVGAVLVVMVTVAVSTQPKLLPITV